MTQNRNQLTGKIEDKGHCETSTAAGGCSRTESFEERLIRQTHALQERIKEINCLYGISRIVDQPNISLEEIYRQVTEIIPASWQYPDITCARCTIRKDSYQTRNYRETPWQQTADVVAYQEVIGSVTVGYLEPRPDSDEGPFMEEERSLLNAIAERLGRTSEQKKAEKALFESEQQLTRQNLLLKEKNIALREVMNQVIQEKENLENRVMDNVEQLLLPLLARIKETGSQIDRDYLNLLENTIKELGSSFGAAITRRTPRLTPRETEICNMIRSGLTSKEIARILTISYRSVETYRNYIRKKLGIINQKVNLTSYLKTLK